MGPMDLHKFHEAMNARTDARKQITGIISDMISARSKLAEAAGAITPAPANVAKGGNVFTDGRQAATDAGSIASRLRENDTAQKVAKKELEEAVSSESTARMIKIGGCGVVLLILFFWLFR
jgi:hypothetical protein